MSNSPATSSPVPVPPEIIAVIAAALAVVLEQPHRVIAVEHSVTPPPTVNLWALAGRMEQFVSHRLR